MSESGHIIGTALRDLADEATPPRLNADALWRAGRRRRWAAITTSVAGAAAAAALIPLAILNASAKPASAPMADRPPPVQFRQVARIVASSCPPRSHGLPGISKDECFYFTQAGMTISTFASVKIIHIGPALRPGLSDDYVLSVRLQRADIPSYADLTRRLVNQHSPRDQLAIIANGTVILHPNIVTGVFMLRPYIVTTAPSGIVQIGAWRTRAQTREFQHRLEQR